MNKCVVALLLIVSLESCASLIGETDYAVVPDLAGIGCLRIGETRQKISESLDSCYLAYRPFLRSHGSCIDYVTVSRNKMLQRAEIPFDIPDKYNKNYHRYSATLIISEELAVADVELYFWKDTLHAIKLGNAIAGTRDVAEAMIWKYGKGKGYYKKTSTTENQLHKWGNDKCIARYKSDVTYTLGSNGLVNGVKSWFHEIHIVKNDIRMQQRIDKYMHEADSLWHAGAYRDL